MFITKENRYRGMIILGAGLLVGGSLLLAKRHLEVSECARFFARVASVALDDGNALATVAEEEVGE